MFVTEAADLAFKLAEQGQPFSYYAALDLVIEEAHSKALSEDLWRCDSSGNVLPVADSYRRRAAQHSVADAWTTGSTFALMNALSATQSPSKVSLVKSAPATYCTDVPQSMWQRWIGRNNDLNMLRVALKG